MNLKQLKNELRQRGIFLSKKRGQNFLIDQNVIDSLLENVKVGKEDSVLEIGAGFGALTKSLLHKGAKVCAYEIDRKVFEFLKENFGNNLKLKLFHEDFLKSAYLSEMKTPFRVIANIPYNISSQVLIKLWEDKDNIKDIYLLLQKEVGERLASKNPGTEIGFLSVLFQLEFNVKKIKTVSRNSFFPVPEVDSVYIELIPRKTSLPKSERKKFFKFLKYGFSERRKKLLKKMKKNYPDVGETFKQLSLSENLRAENLKPEDWLVLFDSINCEQ